MEGFKWVLSTINELSRNTFRFLPFVGPRKYLGTTRVDNKVVIVTGGNIGIGKETARELAARGAKVIIGCRDVKRGQDAADQLNKDKRVKNNGKVIFKKLDLASFESIRKFVKEINNEEELIDMLINNAGVMLAPKETRTKEGFEMHFGVNHLGHFLLTMLLLDKLKQAKSIARIINVSSSLYFAGTIQFDDINMDHNFDKTRAYGQSKLANILFTRELAKRTKGTNIRAYSLHPGAVNSNLAADDRAFQIMKAITRMWYIPVELGTQTTLYCALDPQLANESGEFYANCTRFEHKKCAVSNYKTSQTINDETAKKLWDLSCELVKLEDQYNIPLVDDHSQKDERLKQVFNIKWFTC